MGGTDAFGDTFERDMRGIYRRCQEKHLHSYLAEFDFRYSNRVRLGVNDIEGVDHPVMGVVGKRF